MELYDIEQYGLLEELLGLTGAVGLNNELCTDEWMNLHTLTNPAATTTYTSDHHSLSSSVFNEIYGPLEFPQQHYSLFGNGNGNGNDILQYRNLDICTFEQFQAAADQVPTTFNMGTGTGTTATTASVFCPKTETNKKVRKHNVGQPCKNLMAERRRRKRLNDRLSMLRSIVPKISKMDRTSILGDTIDYLKELLERINNLQENQLTIFKDAKPNEILVRNSPKFDVERRDGADHTGIDIWCAGKPGLLLSTLNTLEALGIHIHHCVISCFNDFAMQASCQVQEKEKGHENENERAILSSEDIKQALFRNAGYGGRCL